MLIFFIVLFYYSIVLPIGLPIVLQSNLQSNFGYRQYAYKKKLVYVAYYYKLEKKIGL